MSSPNQFKQWMRAATTAEQHELAAFVGTAHTYLYHWASDESAYYHRKPEADTAAKIEAFTLELNATSKGRTPVVYRTDLVTACRNCVFAQRCLGARALASQFPYVEQDDEGSLK